MKIITTGYIPLRDNTGDIGNGTSEKLMITSDGWIRVGVDTRPNNISLERPSQPFIRNGETKINPRGVFIVRDFLGNVHHINLGRLESMKFLYLNRSLWIQSSENIKYVVNLFYLTTGVILAIMNFIKK